MTTKDKPKCELCGSPVKVVGTTTMHYEPASAGVEAMRAELAEIKAEKRDWIKSEQDAWRCNSITQGKLDTALADFKQCRAELAECKNKLEMAIGFAEGGDIRSLLLRFNALSPLDKKHVNEKIEELLNATK